jgi:two-component system, cell cycle response regulator DivK
MTKRRILVVDDEEQFTQFIHQVLARGGTYEVREENRGPRVIHAIREFHPDLILLDINIPEISGDEIAAMIREDKRFCRIPVIFVTALMTHDEAVDKVMGRSLVLSKPVGVEKLLDSVQAALEESL